MQETVYPYPNLSERARPTKEPPPLNPTEQAILALHARGISSDHREWSTLVQLLQARVPLCEAE